MPDTRAINEILFNIRTATCKPCGLLMHKKLNRNSAAQTLTHARYVYRGIV